MSTASDYDARRTSDADAADKSELHELASLPQDTAAATEDDPNDERFFELPGADLSGEELSATVIPLRADEFTCSSCFLVQHRNRLSGTRNGRPICADCA